MNALERQLRRVDAFQQRHAATSCVIGLIKKFGDDNGGALASRLSFAIFMTIFPLLLLLVTVLALVLSNDPAAQRTVLDSAYGQIPVVGSDLARNIHAMKRNSAFGLVVGLLGLSYGLNGLAGVGLQVMEQVWYLPNAIRPNYWTRMARSFVFIAVLGLGLAVTTFLSSFGTFGGHSLWYSLAAELVAAVANVGLYLAGFRVLTPRQVGTRCLLPGVVAGGILWTVLQAVGGYVVEHYLRSDNAVYGAFGTVLGLIAWFAVAAQLTIYCAELNSLLVHRLWPRGIVQPPLTRADQELAALQATMSQARPEVEVVVRVHGRPMSQGEYLTGAPVEASVIGTERRVPHGPVEASGDASNAPAAENGTPGEVPAAAPGHGDATARLAGAPGAPAAARDGLRA